MVKHLDIRAWPEGLGFVLSALERGPMPMFQEFKPAVGEAIRSPVGTFEALTGTVVMTASQRGIIESLLGIKCVFEHDSLPGEWVVLKSAMATAPRLDREPGYEMDIVLMLVPAAPLP